MVSPESPVIPPGIVIDHVRLAAERIILVARSSSDDALCPSCGVRSSRVHSSYPRHLADLPWHGRAIEIELRVRRFRCASVACPCRIFAERLPRVMPLRARRTTRLRSAQQHIGLCAGGEPGSRLARHLAMPVSGDTLLRLIRAAELEPPPPARVVGLDDWAFRRGQSYGTIVCDLERPPCHLPRAPLAGGLPQRGPALAGAAGSRVRWR
jgi:transposase